MHSASHTAHSPATQTIHCKKARMDAINDPALELPGDVVAEHLEGAPTEKEQFKKLNIRANAINAKNDPFDECNLKNFQALNLILRLELYRHETDADGNRLYPHSEDYLQTIGIKSKQDACDILCVERLWASIPEGFEPRPSGHSALLRLRTIAGDDLKLMAALEAIKTHGEFTCETAAMACAAVNNEPYTPKVTPADRINQASSHLNKIQAARDLDTILIHVNDALGAMRKQPLTVTPAITPAKNGKPKAAGAKPKGLHIPITEPMVEDGFLTFSFVGSGSTSTKFIPVLNKLGYTKKPGSDPTVWRASIAPNDDVNALKGVLFLGLLRKK